VTDLDAEVLVIGAGVIGLTTAICLAEAGLKVRVAAADPPGRTTSVAAGAIWGPHLVGQDDRIERWADVTRERLAALSHPDVGAGELRGIVHTAAGTTATRANPDNRSETPAEFTATTRDLTRCPADQVPAGYAAAWRLTGMIIAMPGYLDYLTGRLGRAGGTCTFGERIGRLSEASRLAPAARVIVNCTGCGAHDLVPDPAVTPVRGQVVVTANPGITEFFVGTGTDPGDLTYLLPHGDVIVLGGTEQPGNWSLEPDAGTAERIVARCASIEPALGQAPVLEHRVGLRPARPFVRLEAEPDGARTVVHNYGHGGAGVTLSWGCAEDATDLVLAALA
jgi:D-amino-acid oxidase